MKKIKVLYVEQGKEPYEKEIDNELSSLQALVNGWIELFCPFSDGSSFFCNEEGKFNGMQPNREITSNIFHDVIYGPFFICESNEDGDLVSISDELSKKYKAMFSLSQTGGDKV